VPLSDGGARVGSGEFWSSALRALGLTRQIPIPPFVGFFFFFFLFFFLFFYLFFFFFFFFLSEGSREPRRELASPH